jgi:uncharacterized membrane protein
MRGTAVLKNSFAAGLVLVAPLVVTIVVLRVVVNWLLGFVNPIVRGTRLARYTANDELVAGVLATGILLAAILAVGYVGQREIGRRVFGGFGRGVSLVPFVGTIYGGVRQVASSLANRDERYENVVLVEYPMEGTYVLGFVTGESPAAVRGITGGKTYNVFVPNSPNPTAGALVMASADELHEVDMSVRRGIRLLVTTGLSVEEDDLDELPEGVVR